MPARAYQIGTDPRYFVGLGAGDATNVPPLVKVLKDGKSHERIEAAEELGLIGPNARDAVSALTDAMKDADVKVSLSAAESLALIDPTEKNLVPMLVQWLRVDKPQIRCRAADILGQLGSEAESAIPAFDGFLERPGGS